MKRKSNRRHVVAALGLLAALLLAGTQPVHAADDFSRAVQQIEKHYHVHHSHGFFMGLVGMTMNASQFAGTKNFKIALFEDQRIADRKSETEFDRVLRSGLSGDWRLILHNYLPRSGENNYIYAQNADSKNVKLLIVNLEEGELNLIQVEIDPDRLSDFVNHHSGARRSHPALQVSAH